MADGGAEPADQAPAGGRGGAASCDDWETPPRGPAAPVLHLDGFDGPIDLLLDLAERQRIDLGRLSVVALAEQFVTALAGLAGRVPVERRAEWLVMAARLVLLRARLLLPVTQAAAAEAACEAEREVARLDALRSMRAAAAWLEARPQLGIDVFARPRRGPDPRVSSYMALLEACLTVLRGREEQPAPVPAKPPVIPPLWRLPHALARIRALLAELPEGGELTRFLPPVPGQAPDRVLQVRAALASTFVAGLELARTGAIALAQTEAFGPVRLQASPDLAERATVAA
jgi:segregation and condensation protein A